jgi:hypothetical protein
MGQRELSNLHSGPGRPRRCASASPAVVLTCVRVALLHEVARYALDSRMTF